MKWHKRLSSSSGWSFFDDPCFFYGLAPSFRYIEAFLSACRFRFSSINKEISSSSSYRLSLISSTLFSPKILKFDKHSSFSLVEKLAFSDNFTAYLRHGWSDVCEEPVKLVFWSTNTGRYLFSFWLLFALCWLELNNNKCFSIYVRRQSKTGKKMNSSRGLN